MKIETTYILFIEMETASLNPLLTTKIKKRQDISQICCWMGSPIEGALR